MHSYEDVSLVEFMYPVGFFLIACQVELACIGDSRLCCCGPAFNVSRQLFERNDFPLFVELSPTGGFGRVVLGCMWERG